jgi:uncharacterized protein (UPF0332 family)
VEQVGNALALQAVKLKAKSIEADLFGRSAFNRYYYAVFYVARSMLSDFSPDWKSVPHASVPQLLVGQVRKDIQRFKQKANKLGDTESVSLCSHAIESLDQLSELLKKGYSVRVAADYDTTVSVEFEEGSNQFSLASTTVSTARNWVQRAVFLTSSVRRAWRLAHEN